MRNSDSTQTFLTRLKKEIPRLVGLGMLGEDQGRKILDFYTLEASDQDASRAHAKTEKFKSRIPAIVIGIAVLLIGVGLIFFYAANWRWMPPTAKLIQVFLLLATIYGAAYYLLFVRRYEIVGRGLMLLGMLGYGAAIGLIAQIYHISSQPSNGVLAWLLGVLALSIVMRETWGYFLAALLAFIWNSWVADGSGYGNPNYVFVVFPLLLGWLFYREKSPVGVLIAAGLFFIWYYQVNFIWLDRLDAAVNASNAKALLADTTTAETGTLGEASIQAALVALLFTHAAIGVVLLACARLRDREFMFAPSGILTLVAWLMIVAPFSGLSWPIEFEFGAYALTAETWPFVLQQIGFTALAAGLLVVLLKRGDDVRLPGGILAFALLAMIVPMGIQSALLIYSYVGLLLLIGGMLYFAYADRTRDGEARRTDRFAAIAFTVITLVVKGVGLLILALDSDDFFVAYGTGFIIFATVIFLINQFARDSLKKTFGAADARTLAYRGGIIDGACAIAVFGMMYAMSFEMSEQNSIFTASSIVIVLIALFVTIALGLFAVLWMRGAERLPLALSGVIFFSSLLTLFMANPQVPGIVYSLFFNFLIFLMTGVLIYYSTRISSIALANFAIAGLVIQIMTRYFDWFWDLLSGSVLFIVTGLLVLVGGFLLERNRRRLIATIQENDAEGDSAR
ncbi:MAG: DUF2157 domain-containing protein [bacterium]|nr:DUF2157 domain-containing protein [bacterium]